VVIPIDFNWPLTAIRPVENKIKLLPWQKNGKDVMDKKSTALITTHKKARPYVKIYLLLPQKLVPTSPYLLFFDYSATHSRKARHPSHRNATEWKPVAFTESMSNCVA
jgi:hypothetical protein